MLTTLHRRSQLRDIAFASWSSPIDRSATTTVTSSTSRRSP